MLYFKASPIDGLTCFEKENVALTTYVVLVICYKINVIFYVLCVIRL